MTALSTARAAATLAIAHNNLIGQLLDLRPRDLGNDPSPAAQQSRATTIALTLAAMQAYLEILAADTAASMSLSGNPEQVVRDYMHDMAGELRGMMCAAIEDARDHARKVVRMADVS